MPKRKFAGSARTEKDEGPTEKRKREKEHTKDDKESAEDSDSSMDYDDELKLTLLEAKEGFDKEKKQILDKISEDYKWRFGEVVFARWSKSYLPALILDPYDVPPHPVRQMWLDQVEDVS